MPRFNVEKYIDVQDRINRFWTEYPQGAIRTRLMSPPDDFTQCRYEAAVFKDCERPVPDATGYAFELAGGNGANATSHEENCETSAIGRALANMGYATSRDDRPSRQEMEKVNRGAPPANGAVPHAEQPITDQQKRQIFALSGEIAEAKGWAKTWVKDDLYAFFEVGSTTQLTTAQAAKAIAALYQTKDKGAVFADALQAMKGA